MACRRAERQFESRTVLVSAIAFVFLTATTRGGEIRLKNDTVIQGKPLQVQAVSTSIKQVGGEVTVYPITVVQSGMQRYYVPTRNVIDVNRDAELATFDKFPIRQRRTGGSRTVGAIGLYKNVTQFNDRGRRQITLTQQTAKGLIDITIDQGITEIGPKYIKVNGLNFTWGFSIATTSIPTDALDRMIRLVTDQNSPDDRFTIARFYVQAELYLQALQELESIAEDFPDLKERAEELALQARQLLAQRLINELEHRRERGQHFLAWEKARKFPTDRMSAAILRQVREFMLHYEKAIDDGEHVLALLGELQSQLKNEKQREAVEPLRVELMQQLNYETLARLQPFLAQADDPKRPADEKLALAYSGWVLGETDAIDSLDDTLNLWRARFKMLQYLRTKGSQERALILADLMKIEGIGAGPILKLIANLPPIIETPGIRPGQATDLIVDNAMAGVSDKAPTVEYRVILPTEYTHDKTYPVIVSLHSCERSTQWEARWWGGTAQAPLQAQRHGYIVICPKYLEEGAQTYGYSPMSHYVVLQSVRDARKRFNIDSDRVFLAGHGDGGSAAFDIGMAHPDVFAGVIPISGKIDQFCRRLWRNGKHLPWYVVNGQLDADKFESNARTINSMMIGGYDMILAEYPGRGYESYYAEIHKLFDWMSLHLRRTHPKDIEMLTMRPNNNRFFWLKAETLSFVRPRNRQATRPPALSAKPKTVRAEILDGSERWTVVSITSPARENTLWLSPEMLDYGKRVRVRVNGTQKFNDFIEAQPEAILEDLRLRGDRQKVYQTRIELK